MKKSTFFSIATMAIASVLPFSSVANPIPANMHDLVVTEGQSYTIDPGAHHFRTLHIGKDSKLILKGSTSIVANKFVTNDGAEIIYADDPNVSREKDTFTLHALDASGIDDLKIIANGNNGADASQTRAPDGAAGRNAQSRMIHGEWYEVPYWKSETSTPGHQGHNGAPGSNGQHAMDVTLYLPGVHHSTNILVEAFGGDGGKGQPGGYGGKGGDASNLHLSSNGGPGGNGGKGGNGGDAGKITIYLIPSADAGNTSTNPLDWISVKPLSQAGIPGAGGDVGVGGVPGNGTPTVPGHTNASHNGANGINAGGSWGKGPKKNEYNPLWSTVEVMDKDLYQMYVVQVLSIAMSNF